MNRTETNIKKPDNPVIEANFFSKWLFWWLKDFFQIGLKRQINENDIYAIKPNLLSNKLTDKFSELWERELEKELPNFLNVIFKLYGLSIIFWGIIVSAIETGMRLIQPLCLGGLISYFASIEDSEISTNEAYLYAAGIVLSIFISFAAFHPFILWLFEIGTCIRLGCSGLLYRKALRLSKSSISDGLNGKLINLMSNDLSRFELAVAFFHDVWKSPIETILIGYFIYREIGISAIIGMVFILSFIPLQAWFGKKAAQFRLRTAKRTDFRVKIMNEIISGIQIIKIYAWEMSFAEMINKIRKKEINAVRGTALIRATLVSFTMLSRLSIFLSILTYILFGNVITARKVFVISSLYNIINTSMVYFWPLAITSISEGYVSVKRVQEFLLESENKRQIDNVDISKMLNGKKPQRSTTIDNNIKINNSLPNTFENNINNTKIQHQKGISVTDATAVWELKVDGPEQGIGIFSINLKIVPNELCVIIGQVGSGKSTLLNVIIGELELDVGTITIDGSISYAGQDAWLFDGTIKNNIIFVEKYDTKRYEEVIRICGLERDLQILPHGDETFVGERGISLSGGQKARINLARAIYKIADIYALDDPLSAVDTHIGKHIFEECIEKFLHDKICILVTHQLQYLSNNVKHVVVMHDGRIQEQGTYLELQMITKELMPSTIGLLSRATSNYDGDDAIMAHKKSVDNKMLLENHKILKEINNPDVQKEINAIGAVTFNVYKSYFTSVNNLFYIIFIVMLFVMAQTALSGVDYFISLWVNWEETIALKNIANIINSTEPQSILSDDDDEVMAERQQYIIIYSILIAIALYLFLHRTFAFFLMCLKISINLHDKLFKGITRAKMYFFHQNTSGRILNRFSKDIGGIDATIPPSLIDCIAFYLQFTAIIIIIAIVNYWLIIPTVIMTILLYLLRILYINTGRCTKRIESSSRSPIYSHANATIQGLSTIRAFKATTILECEFHNLQDTNTSAWYLFMATTRAFAFWLDMTGVIYLAIVTFSFFLMGENTMGGNVGLAITQCLNLVVICQWGIRQTAEVENQMTSVERVLEYAGLESESSLEIERSKNGPLKDWPNGGAITFDNLNLKYSQNGDYVLKNLSFKILEREKIGIVGRTGAGKSSIVQAIFRLAVNEGKIIIDNINIESMGLHNLRAKISIIPQDPILFSGSLRFNLDPFNEKDDKDIWNALEQVELKTIIKNTAGGLNCRMSDGGLNFSMGQRQLICLARAILRNNKILILDEATANVDAETDKLIQETIRNKFTDCTVLTIAHRLNTIMDNDRVMVIDEGRIREFNHPYKLLQISNGYFKKLVNETGNTIMASNLFELAKQNYHKKYPIDEEFSTSSQTVDAKINTL